MKHQDLVNRLGDLFDVVIDHNDRFAGFVQFSYQTEDLITSNGVQLRSRFIQNNDPRLKSQDAGYCKTLLLSAR